MIALLPEDPAVLTVDSKSAEPAQEIHLTLIYLGDDVTGWDEGKRERFITHISNAVDGVGAIEARVMGHATFNPDGGPDGDRETCAVYLVGDSTELYPHHKALGDTARALLGADFPPQHQPFLPHITAGYGLAAGDLTYTGPIVFNRVVVALAGRWAEISLVPPPGDETIAPYARTAYAQGWAASGGPMTEQVRAGCTAAVDLAVRNASDPQVLEVTLKLGHLEGTWAGVYQRRERLVTKHTNLVKAVWRTSAHLLDMRAAVTQFRRSLGVDEATMVDVDNTGHRRLIANAVAATVAQSIAGDSASPPDREAITLAVATGMAAAHREGYSSAVMVGADQLGIHGVPYDQVTADHDPTTPEAQWAAASGWVQKMVTGNTTDTGGRLSALAGDGASYDDMLAGINDATSGDNINAVDAYTDQAMATAFAQGAMGLLGVMGVQDVDFITAGVNTCRMCAGYEDRNPWPLWSVPAPPIHPHCMCTVGATKAMTGLTGLLSRYLAA
jgi:2'-5' RNA ligase